MAGGLAHRAVPSVTAVVLNWCNERDTADCLASLLGSDYPALSVLLVDNGSPDGSGDRLHAAFSNIPYLQTGANLGYAGGNNRGIQWALERKADFLLVLNNDATVDPSCVSTLVRAAEATGAAVVAPEIRYASEPHLIWYAGGEHSRARGMGIHWDIDKTHGRVTTRTPVSFVSGCCLLIRSAVLRDLGGFDDAYFAYVEDAEFSVRLARAGRHMIYEPTAHALHRTVRGARPTPFQIQQRDRNRRRLVRRHYGPLDRLLFAAWYYPTRLIRLGRYVVVGRWSEARAILSGTFGTLNAS